MTHGFLAPSGVSAGTKYDKLEVAVDFIRDSVNSYARSALPFVSDAHILVHESVVAASNNDRTPESLRDLQILDDLYEAMTLNHVARRASKTQGVALLSLYSKGFTRPALIRGQDDAKSDEYEKDARIGVFIDKLKLAVRREETHGHLPVCWGVLTAALGLSLGANVPFSPVTLDLEFTISST